MNPIITIARFEAKTLVRGWLFKIFAILSIFIISIIDLVTFSTIGIGMPEYRIAGGAPYLNLLLLNFIQAVITIFLSSEFIGRDKKMDTTEAFYVRSLSNFSYVIGKTIGIVGVFLIFNLVILLIGFAFNISYSDTLLLPITYLIYPLIISLPTIMLILGLSFFLMTLIKNQAVTFIIMLGIIGASLIYLSGKFYSVFDIVGVNTTMVYSIFTGLPDVANLLLVRGAYILSGFGFIFFTILMLPRLPQEKHFKTKAFTGMALTFIPAIIMISVCVTRNSNDEKLRADILALEETLPAVPSLKITDNHISLIHKGKTISVSSKLIVFAENDDNLSLILNSGFDVKSIKINGNETFFERNLHTILLKPDYFPINKPVEIEIVYSGCPNDKTTFPEIPEDARNERQRLGNLCAGKQIAYILPNYILLTAEADWYPVAASSNYRSYRQFTNFTLDFESSSKMTAFSQGKKETDNNGKVRFISEQPLKALSLTAGKYETRSLIIDSVEVTLALYPKHLKIYENNFKEIVDTIPHLLLEMKNDYERKLGLPYQFERFSLIEVPAHFYSYPRNWTLATEDNMPEQLLLIERGGADILYDIKLQDMFTKNDNNDNKKLAAQEMQVAVFKNIIGNMLFSNSSSDFGQGSKLRNLDSWNKHSIFPQYTTNAFGIEQNGFPALCFIIENYIFPRTRNVGSGGLMSETALMVYSMLYGSNPEQLILKLKDNTFISLLDSMKYDPRLADLVSRKGKELFEIIRINLDNQDIDEVLNNIIVENRSKSVNINTFTNSFDSITNKNISHLINNWLHKESYPAFLFGETRVSSVKDGNRDRFFVRFQVVNNGTGSGILTVSVREQSGQSVSTTTTEKTFEIPVGQPMEIGIMSDYEPREIIINTYSAQNLPTSRRILIDNIIEEKISGFDGIRPFKGTISATQPYEYVVDNEDEGFSVFYQQEKNTLKDWWMARNQKNTGDKYKSINTWQPSHKWEFILGDNYYGNYIKSAVYIRKGNGLNKIRWETQLPESGNYSVYVYIPKMPVQDVSPFGINESATGFYSFTVTSDDGEEIVNVDVTKNDGWYFIGDFYISQGNTSISLNDKTNRRIVVGDAVKWVKK